MSNQALFLIMCLAIAIVYCWRQLVMLLVLGAVTVLLVGAHELLAHLAILFRP